jgi:hypothetical protein
MLALKWRKQVAESYSSEYHSNLDQSDKNGASRTPGLFISIHKLNRSFFRHGPYKSVIGSSHWQFKLSSDFWVSGLRSARSHSYRVSLADPGQMARDSQRRLTDKSHLASNRLLCKFDHLSFVVVLNVVWCRQRSRKGKFGLLDLTFIRMKAHIQAVDSWTYSNTPRSILSVEWDRTWKF